LFRPDGFYGLSKAYREMLARMYWEKHAVESVVVRIGSVLPSVPDERMLSTWLSHDDMVALMQRCAETERVGCAVIWGASNNSRNFWGKDDRARIGWAPRDSSDDQAAAVRGRVTSRRGDEVATSRQFACRGGLKPLICLVADAVWRNQSPRGRACDRSVGNSLVSGKLTGNS